MIILIKLIAAHLIGDFLLQTDKMSLQKVSGSLSVSLGYNVFHSLIQALLSYIFLAQWYNWIVPVVIGISHFLIDLVKSNYKKGDLIIFIIDQIAHYMVIFIIWWLYYIIGQHTYYIGEYIFSYKFWVIITAFIAILKPTSILIKLFLEYEKWVPDSKNLQGLPNAGKWIGYLERILILIFIFTQNIEGIGFLLAAKSVFRFGELSKLREIKITEYVLIGTFASFTLAIIIGFISQWVVTSNYEIF